MSTPITVIGTIATDLKQIVTQAGVSLTSFRLASGERRYDRQQQKWVDGETNWYGVTAFRTLGAHAQESFHKGERVIVSGRLRIRKWESGERSGISVDIEADAIGHDIRWGVSRFEKRSTPPELTEALRGVSPGLEAPGDDATRDHDEFASSDIFVPENYPEDAPFASAEITANARGKSQQAA